jgi:type IX secretion system PorP/SprF family membrane protein
MAKCFGVIVFLVWGMAIHAQDVHYSQFYMNPVYLNPALSGNFDGDFRASAQQRSQWRSVSRPYNTFGFSFESKQPWVLPGMYHAVNLFHDVAGDGNFRTTELGLTTAYQLYLDNDSIHSVTPAVQLSLNHRTIDFSKLSFGSQFNGFYYDPSLPTNEIFQTSSRAGFNFALGAIYSYKPAHRKELVAGVGWFNIPQPKQSFYNDDGIKRDRRLLFHARAVYALNFEWDVQPAISAQFQGKYVEVLVGSNFRYIMKDRKGEYLAPYAGIFYRSADAAYLTGGVYYNNWIAGISYDINVSGLTVASKTRGALEFQLQYIFHIFKPKVAQFRVCPDYL